MIIADPIPLLVVTFRRGHLDVHVHGGSRGCMAIITCELALHDFLLVTALTFDIRHFGNILVFRMYVFLAHTWVPLELFGFRLFDLDALFPVKLVLEHEYGTDCTLDTVVVCIPYFRTLTNDIVVRHSLSEARPKAGRGLGVLAVQSACRDCPAGDHAFCETTDGRGFHAEHVRGLLVAQEWYEVVVELVVRHDDARVKGDVFVRTLCLLRVRRGWRRAEGGVKAVGLREDDVVLGEDIGPCGHDLETACIDGALQGLDGLDDLVGFEAERLELGDGKRVELCRHHQRCAGQAK